MKNKEGISYIVIFCLVIALIVSFAKINSLESNITLIRNDHSGDIRSLEQQIANIHSEVDEKMKKHTSLFSDISVVYDTEVKGNKGDVTFTVTPKTFTDDMVLKITHDNQTVTMDKTANGKYSGTIAVDMFTYNPEFPLVTITSKGETKTEYLSDISLSVIWPDFLPSLIGNTVEDVGTTRKYKDGKLPIRLIVETGYNPPNNETAVKFTDTYLLVEVNDKEVDRKYMNDKFKALTPESNITEFIIEDSYDISKTDKLSISVVGHDELGFIHKLNIYGWVHPNENGAQPEPTTRIEYAGETIFDKDGNLLFSK